MNEDQDIAWYLAQTKPNGHRIALRNLDRQGFRTFLPTHDAPVRKRGKTVIEQKPLFPGYLFVGVDSQSARLDKVNSTFGVNRLVAFGASPVKVPVSLINGIRTQCDESGKLIPPKSFGAGATVKITAGPFSDLLATVEEMDGQQRVWVLLDILGKDTRVAIPTRSLRSA